jgi:hypothetical protein
LIVWFHGKGQKDVVIASKSKDKPYSNVSSDSDFVMLLLVTAAAITIVSILLMPMPPPSSLFAQDNGFLTYENPDYNIMIDYPANWTKSELNLNPYELPSFIHQTEWGSF